VKSDIRNLSILRDVQQELEMGELERTILGKDLCMQCKCIS